MISDSKKFIFIHISKCAGTSITSNLSKYKTDYSNSPLLWKYGSDHSIYTEYNSLLKNKISDFFIFSFVRNPYDRFLSLYTYWREGKHSHTRSKINGIDIAEATWRMDFNSWVSFINLNKISCRHMNNQLNWLLDKDKKINSRLFVGRFENINYDFKKVCDILNIEKSNLKKLNYTSHHNYREVYNNKSIKIVSKRFQKDLDYFNYKF